VDGVQARGLFGRAHLSCGAGGAVAGRVIEGVVETGRLRLRVRTPDDRAVLHGWFGDPLVMADLGPVRDAAASDATIARHQSYQAEGLGFWIVESRADRVPVGFCGLKPSD